MESPRGFTLIELLVVIAIIGILSSVVLASLSTAKSKGNDAARISDIKAIETAMEMYYNDYNKYPDYPPTSGNGDKVLSDSPMVAQIVPKYLTSMPSILVNDGVHYYPADGQTYGLLVYTEGSGVWCKTGVSNNMSTNGWWGSPPVCNF
jgi:type II secretion system protein G